MRVLCAVLLVLPVVLGAGCASRAQRDRGAAGVFDSADLVAAPKVDRCARLKGQSAERACKDARTFAEEYVRKLSTMDEVCLENGFGDEAVGVCKARAVVADAGTGRVLIEIRDAQPGSRWFERIQHQVWFAEGALVDLYLAEHGY